MAGIPDVAANAGISQNLINEAQRNLIKAAIRAANHPGRVRQIRYLAFVTSALETVTRSAAASRAVGRIS